MLFFRMNVSMLLLTACLLVTVVAMLSKRARPWDAEALPPHQKMRRHLQDLAGGNVITAQRAQEMLNTYADANVPGCHKLKRPLGSNVSRSLRRGLLKNKLWPTDYKAFIRVHNTRTDEEDAQLCSFLLPHELIFALQKHGDLGRLLDKSGLDSTSLKLLQERETWAGGSLLGLGLWTDGVPCNWDRSESVEVVSLSLPGQVGKYKNLRIPLVAIPRKQVGPNTFDDIFEVLAWSFHCCSVGVHPQCRHDDLPWNLSDASRKKVAGHPLHVRGCLLQFRGDWKCYAEVFKFPLFFILKNNILEIKISLSLQMG